LISFSPVLVHVAQGVGPNAAGFWRNLLGGLILAAAALSLGQPMWRGWANLGLCVATGFFFALDLSFWHRSVHLLGPGISTILVGFQVFVMAGAGLLFLKERITWRLLVSIPLALAGLYLLVGLPWFEAGQDYKWGVGCGLIAALALGLYMLSLKHLQSRPGNQSHLGQHGPGFPGRRPFLGR
jgi:drug/metabolite transporter (DMT)-like permease